LKEKEQLQFLEGICDELEGLNIDNFRDEYAKFQKDYSTYKLNYCIQKFISIIDDKTEYSSKYSNILEDWN
jgi:hypothetical protein